MTVRFRSLALTLVAAAAICAPLTALADTAPVKPAAAAHAKPAIASFEAARREAQQKLQAAGDYKGPIDGKRNVAYVSALKNFQTAHHLKATGRLNAKTQAALSA